MLTVIQTHWLSKLSERIKAMALPRQLKHFVNAASKMRETPFIIESTFHGFFRSSGEHNALASRSETTKINSCFPQVVNFMYLQIGCRNFVFLPRGRWSEGCGGEIFRCSWTRAQMNNK